MFSIGYGLPTVIMRLRSKLFDALKPRVAKYAHDTLYRPWGNLVEPQPIPILQSIYQHKTREWRSFLRYNAEESIVLSDKACVRTSYYIGYRRFVDMADLVKFYGNMKYQKALEFVSALPAEHLKYIKAGVNGFYTSK